MDWRGAIQQQHQWAGAQLLEPRPPQQQQPEGQQGWLDAAQAAPSGAWQTRSLAAQWRAALRPPDLDDGEPPAKKAAEQRLGGEQLPRRHGDGGDGPSAWQQGTGPGQRLVPALQQAPGHPAQTVPGGAAVLETIGGGVSSHQLQWQQQQPVQWQQPQWQQPQRQQQQQPAQRQPQHQWQQPPPQQQPGQWQQPQWQQQQGPPAHPPAGQQPGRQPLRLRLADWGLPPRVVEVRDPGRPSFLSRLSALWRSPRVAATLALLSALSAQAFAAKGVQKIYPWQAAALECGEDSSNLVYCAPTSGGKSLVADVLMIKRLIATSRFLGHRHKPVSTANQRPVLTSWPATCEPGWKSGDREGIMCDAIPHTPCRRTGGRSWCCLTSPLSPRRRST